MYWIMVETIKFLVVLPTYNEKDNIREIVERIIVLGDDIGTVIVDDNSPDGTGQTAEELSLTYPGRVWIVKRKGRRGRGLAGIEGFKYALAKGADYVLEMDADLSHRPEDMPVLLEKIKTCDVVLGSRYVEGGGETGRTISRKTVSFLARLYLRIFLGVPVKDPASGFRCFRREVLTAINLDGLFSRGPSIVEEVLYKCHKKGFRIAEVPITFLKRQKGESKLNWKILLSCLILPFKIRCHELFKIGLIK